MKKLFTVLLTFSDHALGVGQYEKETPLEALKEFILTSESLMEYDRDLLLVSILPFIHVKGEKGLWIYGFDPETDLSGKFDNPILGGTIIQTDPVAPTRE